MALEPRGVFEAVWRVFRDEFALTLYQGNKLAKCSIALQKREQECASYYNKAFPSIAQFMPAVHADYIVVPPRAPFAFTGLRPFSFRSYAQRSQTVLAEYLTDFFGFKAVLSETGNKAYKGLAERCTRDRLVPVFKLELVSPGKTTKGQRDSVTMQSVVWYRLHFCDQKGRVVRGTEDLRSHLCEYQLKMRDGAPYVENLNMAQFALE